MNHIYIALALGAGAIIAGVLGYLKSKKTDVYSLYVEATHTSELAAGVPCFFGGTVAAGAGQAALTGPYSKQACVYYKYVIEQEVERRDAQGNTNLEWQTIQDMPATSISFTLDAANGEQVVVNPTGAEMQKLQEYSQFVDPSIFRGDSSLGKVAGFFDKLSGQKVRVREQYLPIGQQLYAGGVAMDQSGKKVFANDQSYPLVLSPQSKADLLKSGHRTSMIEYAVCGLLLVAAIVVFAVVKK